MRILMLTQNIAGLGGTYARCFSMARGLAARGHAVTLLAASRQPRVSTVATRADGVEIIEAGGLLPMRFRHGGLSPLDLLHRLRFIRFSSFDLVHSLDHRPTVSFAAAFFARSRRRPWVADWCDLWGREGLGGLRNPVERVLLTPADAFLEQWTIARASAATVISSDLRRRALERGKPSERILQLPPSANDDRIVPETTEEARRKWSVPAERPVVVFSGHTRLGARLLGEAFARVARRHPSILLVLMGGPQPDLDRIISRYGLSANVRHYGPRADREFSGLLACGDVMLLPYPDTPANRAGFANKLADYLAAGRPVATNQTGDLGALVADQEVGIATDDDPQSYANGICRLLEDRTLRDEMGARARRLAETTFSFRTRAAVLEAFYQGL